MPRAKRRRQGAAAAASSSSAARGSPTGDSRTSADLIKKVRRALQRRAKDPNSIGLRATRAGAGDAASSAATDSPTLTGVWRFLNRSKIIPQPFHYTRASPRVGEYPGDQKSGPEIWHPACTPTSHVNVSSSPSPPDGDPDLTRTMADGIGELEDEQASTLHPAFFGRIGGSLTAREYNFRHDSPAIIAADEEAATKSLTMVVPSKSARVLSAREKQICAAYEGKWTGSFVLPVRKNTVLQINETFELRGVGPCVVQEYRPKKRKVARGKGSTMAKSAPDHVSGHPMSQSKKSAGDQQLSINGDTGAELLSSALAHAMHRRSVPVLGRGRNEYGCFTLSGRLYLDNLDGGDEVIRDADSRRGANRFHQMQQNWGSPRMKDCETVREHHEGRVS